MPTPHENESEKDFVERCVPMVIEEGTAKDGEQANAMCHSMYEEHKKKMEPAMKGLSWYQIKSLTDISEIWLYGEIGKDIIGDGIPAVEFIAELNSLKSPHIDLHINSPGGVVFDGMAIFNAIKRHPSSVTTYIDGLAGSIASVVALAGDKIRMAANAYYMIHNPSSLTYGTSEAMRKRADIMDKVRDTMVDAYMSRSGKDEATIRAMMDAESWLDAEDAKEAGFIDEIIEDIDMAACAKFVPAMAKAGFKHIPQSINGKKETPSLKDTERALRDAGHSRKVAKSILAKGYSDGLRDAGADEDAPPVTDPLRDAEPIQKPAGRTTPLRIAERHAHPKYSTN